MVVPRTSHTELQKWARLIAQFTEMAPEAAYYKGVSDTYVSWQHRVIQHILSFGHASIPATIEERAVAISWDLFDYLTRLDYKLKAEDDTDDYRPLTREEYIRLLVTSTSLSADKEAYLLHINSPEHEQGPIQQWRAAWHEDARWLTQDAEPVTMAAAVAGTGVMRDALQSGTQFIRGALQP